ncbi:MFS transporter [Phytohabitans flavus]|uniref:MFS transporter n=1 Tax=Phytohabitans flavus TaxID=1076124 RepID=A0A6F8Y6T1_9ACTN|nr:MFS transporter [Phytohabitans flavus]BCB81770.1 MFS transporter [Phytohabitans flavus]
MTSIDDRAALRRARVSTSLLFLLFGTALGTWTARIPAIKQDLSLSDGQLSVGLLVFAAGAITGMQAMGRVVDRWGSRRVTVPVAFAEGAALVLPALAGDLALLAGALFLFGTVHGSLNIAMNASAVAVERAWGRPIMSSFHAVYSLGGFLGAAIGGLFAYGGVAPDVTFLAVGVLAAALAAWSAAWRVPRVGGPVPVTSAAGAGTGPMPGVLFLGVLAYCCLVGEGAAADWSTVYLRESLGSSPGFAAAAYAAFSIGMTGGRLVGDRLAAALGPVRLVQGCGLLAAAGLGTALLVSNPVAGVAGFGCLGAGLSCIAPQVFSAAGNRDPARAGRALARVASMGYAGFLTGPVLIGGVAEATSLPVALGVPVVLALFVAGTASALRPIPAPMISRPAGT